MLSELRASLGKLVVASAKAHVIWSLGQAQPSTKSFPSTSTTPSTLPLRYPLVPPCPFAVAEKRRAQATM